MNSDREKVVETGVGLGLRTVDELWRSDEGFLFYDLPNIYEQQEENSVIHES